MNFERLWAMPTKDTFTIPEIRQMLEDYLAPARWHGKVWIDPFAGFHSPCPESNDLNPDAPTKCHLDAREFVKGYDKIDGLILDPPYSPTQIARVYKSIGLPVARETTQHAKLVGEVKDLAAERMPSGAVAICFGWNSNGMGAGRGFHLHNVILVAHGAAHNDTIITVEVKK